MKWDRLTVIIAAIALVVQLATPAVTGGFTVTSKIESLSGEIKLLRHEVIAQNALQDAEIHNLKARIGSFGTGNS